MSININRQTTQKNIVIEQNNTQKQQDVNKKGVNETAKNQDSVQLTSQAKNLNKMQPTAEPQVNKQRVETLKAAILNGDYKINTERLAEKLTKFESDFSKAFA
ncbi:flagellar biosynthesis anti-sigma factor FlgM [Psychromonas sp. psych-6C06]|uniref:flagellar biosynthesis anti-sigma factor FlgM n=1 Tax=Psychromonas sp. psych-6C06 TaxID=2058089 RepID=UPI000C32B3A9|nr:flagellar biosynthesis anti-sigma factor FlgM [Psychromonas sp. psych-6C06]PKF62774.1 flagellar biosynthesis anti-sigma factor FlgM [Psychromonas sp. psych-6C06]